MAGFVPFQANSGATVGKTVAVNVGTFGTLVNTFAPCIQVSNPNSVQVFVRLSTETAPVATAADAPVAANSVRLFSNPVPLGTTGLAVVCSVTTSQAFPVYFTPGQGGI